MTDVFSDDDDGARRRPGPASSAPGSRPRRSRRRSSPYERWMVRAVSVLSGVLAATAGGNPTAAPVADAVIAFLFGALVAYASSYARRWTWPVLAGFAALFADGTLQLVVAAVTVAVAVAAMFVPVRSRLLGAIVGMLAVQLLLRQGTDAATYLPTLVTAVAIAPTMASAYENGPRRFRHRVHIGLAVGAAVALVGAMALAVSALGARSDVREAIRLAEAGLDAAQDGDTAESTRLLQESSRLFDEANSQLTALWALPARVVPVVGNNANALVVATEHGRALTATAAETAEVVDLDDLSFSNGRLDLTTVIAYNQPVENAAVAAEEALEATTEADSPWLVGPVDTRLTELLDELNESTPKLRNAANVVHITPDLLGVQAERTYLVLFFTPSEIRGLGGFIGAFAELRALDGRLELVRTGRPDELNTILRERDATLRGPEDYLAMWGHYDPQFFFQDISFSPDFPAVADVATQLYAQAGGPVVDGVIALDPYALAALTEFTGPIELNGQRYGPNNLADYLLNGQYLEFEGADQTRQDALDAALREVFTQLLLIDTPSPRAAARTLGPVVDGGRLMFTAANAIEFDALQGIGVTGEFPDATDRDLLGVTAQNNANNKIDYYLERTIDYRATVADNGRLDATVTIEMTNTAPPDGGDLPESIVGSNDRGLERGLNRTAVTVYTPHLVEAANIDGVDTGFRTGQENGVNAYSITIDLSAGQTRTLELSLLGAIADPDEYTLVLAPQPTVEPDLYRISVEVSSGPTIDEEVRGIEDFVLPAP